LRFVVWALDGPPFSCLLIQIGNEREGFIPYQQYLAQIEASRRSRGHSRHRPRSYGSYEDERVYIIPPGANVIFVDEEGRELYRSVENWKH
jgi:hypothetical protein